jgi:hypothetical protein
MLTRKHFKAIAEVIKTAENVHQETMDEKRLYIANHLADFCETQNSRFDREKFLTACNV